MSLVSARDTVHQLSLIAISACALVLRGALTRRWWLVRGFIFTKEARVLNNDSMTKLALHCEFRFRHMPTPGFQLGSRRLFWKREGGTAATTHSIRLPASSVRRRTSSLVDPPEDSSAPLPTTVRCSLGWVRSSAAHPWESGHSHQEEAIPRPRVWLSIGKWCFGSRPRVKSTYGGRRRCCSIEP